MAYTPTPAEKQELADIQQYLKHHAEAGTVPAEGSFTRVLRNASPNVRANIVANKEFAEHLDNGGRSMPFADRLEHGEIPEEVRAVRDQLYSEEISARLMDRMGTSQSQKALHYQPPTMRDHIAAAFTDHEGADHD